MALWLWLVRSAAWLFRNAQSWCLDGAMGHWLNRVGPGRRWRISDVDRPGVRQRLRCPDCTDSVSAIARVCPLWHAILIDGWGNDDARASQPEA